MDKSRRLFSAGLVAAVTATGLAQVPDASQSDPGDGTLPPDHNRENDRLPNGKSRSLVFAEDQHKRALEEAGELVKMAEDLRGQIESAGKFVVPVSAVRKTEEIEKLARKIRSRLRS